jgi:hypothetical protein
VGIKLGAGQIFGSPFGVLGLGAADLGADLGLAEQSERGVALVPGDQDVMGSCP